MRETQVLCDGCGRKLREVAIVPVTVAHSHITNRYDLCDPCANVFEAMAWRFDKLSRREETQIEKELKARKKDLAFIRETLSDVVTEWGSGNSEKALALLRNAANRAKGET